MKLLIFLSKVKSKHVKIFLFALFIIFTPLSIMYGKQFIGFHAFFSFAIVFIAFGVIKVLSMLLRRDENFYDTKFNEVRID